MVNKIETAAIGRPFTILRTISDQIGLLCGYSRPRLSKMRNLSMYCFRQSRNTSQFLAFAPHPSPPDCEVTRERTDIPTKIHREARPAPMLFPSSLELRLSTPPTSYQSSIEEIRRHLYRGTIIRRYGGSILPD